MTMSDLREISRDLSRRDREHKRELVQMRRDAGLTQADVDTAIGLEPGWTRALEAYDSDPFISELRRYEAYVTYMKGRKHGK